MSEEVTIPDAAREAIVEMVRDAMGWREWDDAEVRQEVDGALAIAAPLIARAAVIAELRTLLGKQETSYNLRNDEASYYVDSSVLEDRIAELEAQNV